MKIEVTFDSFEETSYDSLEEAKAAILDANANGVGVERIVEVDEDGNEGKEYGCSWSLELEELD